MHMHKAFDVVEERLSDGRKYLLGDDVGFSRVDMVFAVSAALILKPDGFGGGRIAPQSRYTVSELSEEAQEEMKTFTDRPAAAFCFRLFEEERGRTNGLPEKKEA